MVLALAAAGGCSDPATAKKAPVAHRPTAPALNATYANARALAKALQQTHVGCTNYSDDNRHPDAQSQGRCHVRGVTVILTVYATQHERELDVTRLRQDWARHKSGSLYLVVGDRWVVNCGIYQAISELTFAKIGGVAAPSPAPGH